MTPLMRIIAAFVLCAWAACGRPSVEPGPAFESSPTPEATGATFEVSPPPVEVKPFSEPSVKWTQVLSHPTESFVDVSVALNANGATGLFAEIELPERSATDLSYGAPYHAAEVRTYDGAGNAGWTRRSANKIVGINEDAAFNDTYEIESWSSSFVVLRQWWRARTEPFSFQCAAKQYPEDSGSFAMFLDGRGACVRELGLGMSVCGSAFAADPAGTVWYSPTVPGMASCYPPRKVDAAGRFLFNGGYPLDGIFDPATMLASPFTLFEDGRIFARATRPACSGCSATEYVFGPLAENFLPLWTASAPGPWGPFDAGDGDVGFVRWVGDSLSFGGSTVPAGKGYVAFRYDWSGAPKLAVPIQPPFEDGQFLHADAQGFIFSAPGANAQTETEVAAIGWDGALRWRGTLPCWWGSAFAGHPEHGLRFACIFGEGDASRGVRLIALER
jgi:hypothetical protein